MKKEVHVFSDASSARKRGRLRFFGAYSIDGCDPIGIVFGPECTSSTEAELMTAAHAVRLAGRHVSDLLATEFFLHSDLAQIETMLERRKSLGSRQLANAIENSGLIWRVKIDANHFHQHRECHHAAREAAGIYGDQGWRQRCQILLPPAINPPRTWAEL